MKGVLQGECIKTLGNFMKIDYLTIDILNNSATINEIQQYTRKI
jgi:hypothetical protein